MRSLIGAHTLFAAFLVTLAPYPVYAGGGGQQPAVKVGMSLSEVRAAVHAAGWYPPDAPYCQPGKVESNTGYCGLIPASILEVAPEARAAASDYAAVQMCYKDHHGKGFRALFSFKYGVGHDEPPPASMKLMSWDMASANCLSE
jgi:hypothetical protein